MRPSLQLQSAPTLLSVSLTHLFNFVIMFDSSFCCSGVIPPGLGQLVDLAILNLSKNSLYGEKQVDYVHPCCLAYYMSANLTFVLCR